MRPRTRVVLAWALWLVTFGCCAAGLAVTLVVTLAERRHFRGTATGRIMSPDSAPT